MSSARPASHPASSVPRAVRLLMGLAAAAFVAAVLARGLQAATDPVLEGDPFRGREVFQRKDCVRCHSVWGHGGSLGPEITVAVAGKSWDELVGDFWNHTPGMIDEGDQRGYPWPTLDRREMADLQSCLYYLRLFDEPGHLVGTRHGAHRFKRPGRAKSVEGSAAFFLVALPCAYVPLRVWTGGGWAETLLLSLDLALLVTLVEALSLSGLDNLTVPLAAFVLLRTLRGGEPWLLAACAAVTAGVMMVLAFRCVRGTPLSPIASEVVHETV